MNIDTGEIKYFTKNEMHKILIEKKKKFVALTDEKLEILSSMNRQ